MAMKAINSVPTNSGTAPKLPFRANLVGAHRDLRAPLQPKQELDRRDVQEKSGRLENQRENDADSGEDSDHRADDQQHPNDRLDAVPGAKLPRDFVSRVDEAADRGRENDHGHCQPTNAKKMRVTVGDLLQLGIGGLAEGIAGRHILDVVQQQAKPLRRQRLGALRQTRHKQAADDLLLSH